VTGNVAALLPGALVLLDTDRLAADRPRRGVVVRQVHAALGDGVTVEVCVGPCFRPEHSTDCPVIGFAPDDLLLVPAEAAS
jgi:hypothetical protein